MNRKFASLGILLLILLLAVPVTAALADCDPSATGGPGNDTITCSGTTNSSVVGDDVTNSDGGNDIIINSGIVDGDIEGEDIDGNGNGGNDTIINSGIVIDAIQGDDIENDGNGGNDLIINSGIADYIEGDDIGNDGNGGNDTIINSGVVLTYIAGDYIDNNGDGGNDTIINSGTVFVILGDDLGNGNGGDDTIINSDEVVYIVGDYVDNNGNGGNDTIINEGIVYGDIIGDDVLDQGGNDLIIVSGTVYGDINADGPASAQGGDDTVKILDRASVDGLIDGNSDHIGDALHFELKQREATPEEYLWFLEAMNAANAAGGYVCWMGDCYTWSRFERLTWRLDYNFGPAAIYFLDIPLEELPVYSSGSAPYCTFYSGQHGPKWIAPEECGDFTDASALDVVCLNNMGMWSGDFVSGVGATADGKLSFTTTQHGICGVFPSS